MVCPECGKKMKKTTGNYRYKESGMDNVMLLDIPLYICNCGEKMPAIPRILNLHSLIAEEIIKNPKPLTGNEIRFLRKEMGLKANDFAAKLGVNKVTVSRWENDAELISTTGDKLVRSLFILHKEEVGNRHFQKAFEFVSSVGTKKALKAVKISIPIQRIRNYKGFGEHHKAP